MNPFYLDVMKTMAGIVNSEKIDLDTKQVAKKILHMLLLTFDKDVTEFSAAMSGIQLTT